MTRTCQTASVRLLLPRHLQPSSGRHDPRHGSGVRVSGSTMHESHIRARLGCLMLTGEHPDGNDTSVERMTGWRPEEINVSESLSYSWSGRASGHQSKKWTCQNIKDCVLRLALPTYVTSGFWLRGRQRTWGRPEECPVVEHWSCQLFDHRLFFLHI